MVVIGMTSNANPNNLASLYQTVLGILEPQRLVDPGSASGPSSPLEIDQVEVWP